MAGILLLSGKVPALLFDYFKTWGQNMPVYFWGVQRVMLMHTASLFKARCISITRYTRLGSWWMFCHSNFIKYKSCYASLHRITA